MFFSPQGRRRSPFSPCPIQLKIAPPHAQRTGLDQQDGNEFDVGSRTLHDTRSNRQCSSISRQSNRPTISDNAQK